MSNLGFKKQLTRPVDFMCAMIIKSLCVCLCVCPLETIEVITDNKTWHGDCLRHELIILTLTFIQGHTH